MSSRLVVNQIQDSNAKNVDTTYVTNGSAKAFSQTNQRDAAAQQGNSLNVSTVTDGGAGDLPHSFTNNFNSALDYAILCTAGGGANDTSPRFAGPADAVDPTTSGFTFVNANSSGTAQDKVSNAIACYGDLA